MDAGLLSRRQLRSSAWRRLFQGVYADASLAVTHRLRCTAAGAFLLPTGAVIAGRSAALLYGAGLAGPLDPVEALAPRGTSVVPHDGIVVHHGDLADDETTRVGRHVLTTPVRTCWDLALWLDPVEAVVLIDRILGRHLVTIAQLRAYLVVRSAQRPRPRGWRRFARVLRIVDGRAESPQESRLRARLVMAGLPKPRVQFNVRTSDGGFVARVDLAWEECRLAVEYDGLWHTASPRQIHKDRRRLNALQVAGWTVLHVTSDRLRNDLEGVVAEIRAAIKRLERGSRPLNAP